MHRTVQILRQSRIVESILSIDSDAFGENYKLKIKILLINGWKLNVWEHVMPGFRRYAYHVSKDDELIIRWDNAPHHKNIRTFPDHKHINQDVLESNEVTIENILEELEQMILRNGFNISG